MLTSLAIAASLMSVPIPVDHSQGFTSDDFPADVAFAGHLKGSRVALTIRPDASVRSCEITLPSGNAKLDALTCDIFLKRAKYKSGAKWVDGTPIFGVFRQSVLWGMGQRATAENVYGDLNLTLSALPFGLIKPKTIYVQFAADEAGRIVDCGPTPSSLKMGSQSLERVQFACEQVERLFKVPVVSDDSGRPVRSVQMAAVRLTKRS